MTPSSCTIVTAVIALLALILFSQYATGVPPAGLQVYNQPQNLYDFVRGCYAVRNRDLKSLFPGVFYSKENITRMLKFYKGSYVNTAYPYQTAGNQTKGRRRRRQTDLGCTDSQIAINSKYCVTCIEPKFTEETVDVWGGTVYIVHFEDNFQLIPEASCGNPGSCTNCVLDNTLVKALVTNTPPESWDLGTNIIWFESVVIPGICKCLS